jgi:protein-S-isoprenylcysteine O-methyltransferase Ste14
MTIGMQLEERDLQREFEATSTEYQRGVPMLLPRPGHWS